MITRAELQGLAQAGAVDERTQERDYMLAWLLAAMATSSRGLIFKGGTCIRRCYIRGYRYSGDLDFTLKPGAEAVTAVDALTEWCEWVRTETNIQASALADSANARRRAWVSFRGPLGSFRERAIKVDVSDDEEVVDQHELRPLFSEYSDLADGAYRVPSYSLLEIWAEKTRSLMQRSEPRDAYDLSQLIVLDGTIPERARELFMRKARSKGLDPVDLAARLDSRETSLRQRWEVRLGDQLAIVPPFDSTWRAVRRALRQAGYLS